MRNLSNIGRIFYGIAMAAIGFQTIFDSDFPYMLIPPDHFWINQHVIIGYIFGTFIFLAGLSFIFEKKSLQISLLLGTVFLLIFIFYFIPYELFYSPDYMHLGDWENSEKEFALACGAFVIADSYSTKPENSVFRFLKKLAPIGTVFFALNIISFGLQHFLYAKDVAEYIPSWIPNPMLWTYVAGSGLLGFSLAIFLKIKMRLFATLLGAMILIWFIILHIPKVIFAQQVDRVGEITSAFLALAYSGIAFFIAGNSKKLIK